jgi:protein-S-isoprenylcysteine O-methyltransferase Ste14
MREGGPLNYRSLTQDWTVHFAGMDVLLALWAVPLLALTGLYVWATVIFGIRFSNLTHRGIVTNGPYRYFRHPAYLAKSLFWWLMYLPFVPVTDPADAVRATILLLGVNAIYLARARTEERHLMTDPKYRAYAAWIAEHGLLPRALRRLRALAGRPGSGPGGAPLGQREDP